MKNTILISLLSLTFSLYAQTDTIFRTNGKILLVNITEVGETSLKFQYPNESISNSIDKTAVRAIHFRSGRKEEFSSTYNVALVKHCLDWSSVQFSKIESEVRGMQKLTNVGAKAKGMTGYSSIAKLQDRAYNKTKMQTAMLGGNTVYVLEQNTEEAMYGGQYGSSKMPSVNISGIAYSSRNVDENEIQDGTYRITDIYLLETNAYELDKLVLTSPESITINKNNLSQTNGFFKTQQNIKSIKGRKLDTFTIIYANETEMVLSGVHVTSNGKTTYYNVFLKKGA